MTSEELMLQRVCALAFENGRMLSSQCGELSVSLRACEKQLVTCAHAYRAADNFEESQRCSDIAFTARLVLQKWEAL